MNDFSEDIRGLEDATKASEDRLEEPKSAATALQVGWMALMAGLLFCIRLVQWKWIWLSRDISVGCVVNFTLLAA